MNERDPSLRSGFRLRAPASLTPAKRLNFWRVRKDGGISGPAQVVLNSEAGKRRRVE